MENNQFRKMLFESQNSFDKQIKGMKPLNEVEKNFKPKLGTKKQLGKYKEVTINDCFMTLIIEADGDKLLIRHADEKQMSKQGLVSILNYEDGTADGYDWWNIEADYDKSELLDEVAYCMENFDALMK